MKDCTTGGGGTDSYRERAEGSVLLMHIWYATVLAGMGLGDKDVQNVSIMGKFETWIGCSNLI